MTEETHPAGQAETEHVRLSRSVILRIVGSATVVLGVALLALTVASAALGVSAVVPVVFFLLAASGLLGGLWWLRFRAYVLRMDASGYHVALVRGAGTAQAQWREVSQIVATTERGTDLLRLELADGSTTTIPVRVLAADPDQLVSRVRQRAQHGHGLRPHGG